MRISGGGVGSMAYWPFGAGGGGWGFVRAWAGLRLRAAGLFKWVWPFCCRRALGG